MRIIVVDDDALIRDSLKILLELEDDMSVAGCASNGQEAFSMCQVLLPDIVLMDIRMPVLDGVLGTKLIKGSFKDIKVVILTTFRDDEYIKEALKNGAEGYILKNQSSDNIIDSLRAVKNGNTVFKKEIAEVFSTLIKDEKKNKNIDIELTEREMDIIKLVGQGLSNREIANKLFLSDGTVRNYVAALLEKLNLRDRTQLAIFYIKNLEQ